MLQEKVHSLSNDLTQASTENSTLHEDFARQKRDLEEQIRNIEQSTTHIRESEAQAKAAESAARVDLQAQVRLATEAHEKYERELVAHADDVKALAQVKEELSSVRTTSQELRQAAETAEANLSASKASWANQSAALNKELDDLRTRYDESVAFEISCIDAFPYRHQDLRSQNATLHQHLESVSAQAAKIQHAAVSEPSVTATADSDSEGQLSKVVHYLRGQQEILELQLQIEKQEKARMTARLESVERNLDEARARLTEVRDFAIGRSTPA